MKEENREKLAKKYYDLKEALEKKREEHARFASYNKKRAEKILKEIDSTEKELEEYRIKLQEADMDFVEEEEKPLSETLYDKVADLDHYLSRGAQILKSKRRLFFFLFARHPKVVLAQMLFYAAKEARTIPKKITPFKEGPNRELCSEIEAFCQKLIEHSEKRWNHSLYSGEFLELYDEWAILMQELRANS